MNVLAKEQEKLFEKGISEEEYQKRFDEFLKIYYEVREKDEGKIWNKLTLEQRKKIHNVILRIYKIKNKLGGFTNEVLKDKRETTDRPIIFAVTHVGKFDIEVVSEAVKDHYYLLSGDYEHIQGIIDSPFLSLNGVIYFNEKDKKDRKLVSEKMKMHLKSGGNLMYFIEGTWNLTPNLPMLPCYWGIVDVARESNAIIIPVAAEQYGKHFKINIGQNFDVLNYTTDTEGKSEAINELRDVLATLKWEIWESEEMIQRENIQGDEWGNYIEQRLSEWPGFSQEYINSLIYKPKNVVTPEEVYKPIKKLIPNKNNAFLFDKRNKGHM